MNNYQISAVNALIGDKITDRDVRFWGLTGHQFTVAERLLLAISGHCDTVGWTSSLGQNRNIHRCCFPCQVLFSSTRL